MCLEKRSILIVDDEEVNRAILSAMLCERYDILEAENGQQALDILAKEHASIAMVLLDVIMPTVDGFGVLAAMKYQSWLGDVPVVLITAESSEQAAIKGYELGAADIINKPFNPNIVIRRVENLIQLSLHQFHLESIVRDQMAILEKQAQKLKQNSNFMIDTLSTVVEFRSCESGQHVKRMRKITKLLLEQVAIQQPECALTKEQIEAISNAAALHDVGKIAIPDAILNKPGKLTPEEFAVMKTHAVKGCEILLTLDNVQDEEYFNYCYEICRHHHERWDGKGYPDGIAGNNIPFCSQVVGLADVYDALTSERVYKPPFPNERAVKMILDGECGKFNPMLLDCFGHVTEILQEERLEGISKKDKE